MSGGLWPRRLALCLRGQGEDREHGKRRNLDDAGGDPRTGADLGKPEQADPHRQQVSAERRYGEARPDGGHDPAA